MLFVFALGGPTSPTGVERRIFASSVQGNMKADEVGLELVLGLGLIRGLVAESLAAVSLSEKSKKRNKAKSFCN